MPENVLRMMANRVMIVFISTFLSCAHGSSSNSLGCPRIFML